MLLIMLSESKEQVDVAIDEPDVVPLKCCLHWRKSVDALIPSYWDRECSPLQLIVSDLSGPYEPAIGTTNILWLLLTTILDLWKSSVENVLRCWLFVAFLSTKCIYQVQEQEWLSCWLLCGAKLWELLYTDTRQWSFGTARSAVACRSPSAWDAWPYEAMMM